MNFAITPNLNPNKNVAFGNKMELPEPILRKGAEVAHSDLQDLRKLLEGPKAPPADKLAELRKLVNSNNGFED